MKIIIINGPNLNMIGKRDEAFYGIEDFDKILSLLQSDFPDIDIDYYQSNSEGSLIDKIQEISTAKFRGLIINPGGYSHYSIAIQDALRILQFPILEVHFSNIFARGGSRAHVVTGAVCDGLIAGMGKDSYRLALEWFKHNQTKKIGF